jgi:hypothetical protein
MKHHFKTEKHAREELIGRAHAMAERAVRERRDYSDAERRKVEGLLMVAEALQLGTNIPRKPAELVKWNAGGRTSKTRRETPGDSQ